MSNNLDNCQEFDMTNVRKKLQKKDKKIWKKLNLKVWIQNKLQK